MPGAYNPRNRPRRPGAYFNWSAEAEPVLLPNAADVVGLIFTGDWGPLEEVVTLNSFRRFLDVFGASKDTAAYRSVKGAFTGEGVPGRGGAGQVLAYRVGSASAAKATLTINNTGAAGALRVDARYFGAKGNDLRIELAAGTGGNDILIVYDDTTELERYTYPSTNLASLATDVNDTSNWITATVLADGVALDFASDGSLTGGDDGGTLVDGDWTAAYTALGQHRLGVMAFHDALPAAVQTGFDTFVETQNDQGRRFMAVVGGGANETLSTANTRSQAYNNPEVINLGAAMFTDADLGELTTGQLAARVAGVVASRGERQSLTFARFAGLTLKSTGATDDTVIEGAFDAGTVVFTQDSHPDAPVRIEKGITTYTGGDGAKPVKFYSVPKYVRTMHGIEVELTEWGELNVIGQLQVNDDTRALVVGEAQRRMDERAALGILQPGPVVSITEASTDDVEFVELEYAIKFGRSVEQLFNIVRVG